MHHQNDTLILVAQLGFGALMGIAFGVTPAVMIEMLPTRSAAAASPSATIYVLEYLGHDTANRHLSVAHTQTIYPVYYLIRHGRLVHPLRGYPNRRKPLLYQRQ